MVPIKTNINKADLTSLATMVSGTDATGHSFLLCGRGHNVVIGCFCQVALADSAEFAGASHAIPPLPLLHQHRYIQWVAAQTFYVLKASDTTAFNLSITSENKIEVPDIILRTSEGFLLQLIFVIEMKQLHSHLHIEISVSLSWESLLFHWCCPLKNWQHLKSLITKLSS